MKDTMDERFNQVDDQDNANVVVNGSVGRTTNHQFEIGLAWMSPLETPWRKPSLMTVLRTLGKYFH